jgi:hypothetical protein
MAPLGFALLFVINVHAVSTPPNATLTPGALCTARDPNFDKYDYPEQVARCKRNVNTAEKQKVADEYGHLPKSQWSNYEFDHLVPLCAGGSNDITNLWPQPLDQAKVKDQIEDEVCKGMRNGTMSQAQAVARIHGWFKSLTIQLKPQADAVAGRRAFCMNELGQKIRFVLNSQLQAENLSISSIPTGSRALLFLPIGLTGTWSRFPARLRDESGDVQDLECELL